VCVAGFGVYTYANGNTYEGEYLQGEKHGRGGLSVCQSNHFKT
jgi:hypothetical protein